jgi:aspartate/methionine/tyrosine aminotransferase
MKIKLDLGYGNPGFIQELFKNTHIDFSIQPTIAHYKYAKHPLDSLVSEIKKLHTYHQNALITDNTRIIITVGAVQAIQAALSYYQSKGFSKVFVPKPYWGRFDDFINISKLSQISKPQLDAINFITSPNNPDGLNQMHLPAMIRDACYNWSHYSKDTYLSTDAITIFSHSKLSGFSSTRIGWAVVQDQEIADYMQNYVNIFTSGVPIEAQLSADKVIHLINNEKASLLNEAKMILNQRRLLMVQIINEKKLDINILSTDGMFSYIQCQQKIIEDLNIETVDGSFFHDHRANIHRINIGADTSIFNEFIERLKIL